MVVVDEEKGLETHLDQLIYLEVGAREIFPFLGVVKTRVGWVCLRRRALDRGMSVGLVAVE